MADVTHFYQILGLKPGASFEEVKTAYRDLVKVWHPDRFSHDERLQLVAQDKLKEINGAYKMLEAHFFDASIQPETSQSESAAPAPEKPSVTTAPKQGGKKSLLVIVLVLVVGLAAAGVLLLNKKKSKEKALAVQETTPAPHPLPAQSQYSLSFDGSQSQLAIATTGSLTGTFTVECWAMTRRPRGVGAILNSRGSENFSFEVSFRNRKTIHLDLGDGSSWFGTNVSANVNYKLDTWYHIACVITPNDSTVYVNGANVKHRKFSSPRSTILCDANHPVTVGADLRARDYLDGAIADLRIWDTARTAEEIKSDMNGLLTGSEFGLHGYWPFKEGSGTNTLDASGHWLPAQIIGNISWSTNLPDQLTSK